MSGFNYNKWDNLEDSDDETPKAAAPAPAPSRPPAPQMPDLSSVDIDDDRSEVEKLKAKKRAERTAREAEKAKNPTPEPESFMAPVAPTPVAADTNAQDAVQTSTNASKQITAAEAALAGIKDEIKVLHTALSSQTGDPLVAQSLKQRTLNLQGRVGKLQNELDEIYLGEIEDDGEREMAKQRRKAVNRLLEGDIPGQITDLKKLFQV